MKGRGYDFNYYRHQWDAYGVLTDTSVCAGIAIFYSNLCHAADLPCKFVRTDPKVLDHTINYIPDINGNAYFVDVRDLAAGVIAACEKGRRGECYIISNEVVTMHDMFREMNEAAGLSRRFHVLSKKLAYIGVRILSLVSKFTGEEPLLSDFNIYMLNRNNEYDCSKAKRELGFHSRPFSESIRDTVNWLREEGFVDYNQIPTFAQVPIDVENAVEI